MKLKYILLSILTVCVVNHTYSQFLFLKQGIKRNDFTTIIEDNQTANYWLANNNFEYNPQLSITHAFTSFIKINNIGNQLDSVALGENYVLNGKLVQYQNYFYAPCLKRSDTLVNSSLYEIPTLIKYTNTFTKIKELVLDSNKTHYMYVPQNPTILNNIIYTYWAQHFPARSKLFKLDLNLNILDSLTIDGIEIKSMVGQNNHLLISGEKFPQSLPSGRAQVATLDTTFNVLNRLNFDSIAKQSIGCTNVIGIAMSTAQTLITLSNKKYAIVGSYKIITNANCDGDTKMVYAIVENNTVIKGGFWSPPSLVKEDVYIENSQVDKQGAYFYTTATIGMTNDIASNTTYTPTKILITKTDTMGNKIWVKNFDTPNYFYKPLSICVTSDSGVLVCGSRYDVTKPELFNAFEGFVLKLDKNGTVINVGINEYKIEDKDFTIYPNPTTDVVNINFNKALKKPVLIKISNLLGQIVLEQNINSTLQTTTLNIAQLNAGIYNISILMDNNRVTKKIILTK